MIKAMVVGRHEPEFGSKEIKVIRQEAPVFRPETVDKQLDELISKAKSIEADALLFQNTPGVLTGALMRRAMQEVGITGGWTPGVRIGVIVSKPGDRTEQADKFFVNDKSDMPVVGQAVEFANSRAQVSWDGNFICVSTFRMKFEFSHIEWLS